MFDLPDVLGLTSAASQEKTTNGHHQNGNVLFLVSSKQWEVCNQCLEVKMNIRKCLNNLCLISACFVSPVNVLVAVLLTVSGGARCKLSYFLSPRQHMLWLHGYTTTNKHSYSFQLPSFLPCFAGASFIIITPTFHRLRVVLRLVSHDPLNRPGDVSRLINRRGYVAQLFRLVSA